MTKYNGTSVIAILGLIFLAVFAGGCSTINDVFSTKEETNQSSETPAAVNPNLLPSNLFQTLIVSDDSCYVFLKPKGRSSYFGPLLKGEEITKIDRRVDWFYVWILRLRTPGWVYRTKVHETGNTNPDTEGVPKNLFDSLIVITNLANIRQDSTLRARVIHVARKGDEFTLLNERESWYEIWVPQLDRIGWIHEKIVMRKRRSP